LLLRCLIMIQLFVDVAACLLCHCLATDDISFRQFRLVTLL
jgi:hypothetical protein